MMPPIWTKAHPRYIGRLGGGKDENLPSNRGDRVPGHDALGFCVGGSVAAGDLSSFFMGKGTAPRGICYENFGH